ncbi:hypothetical protein CEXT_325951 [Caerostris extrusa]|uniref:Uncharacterized protein n=1 Tax=Caerostris extrusa TaxID=172846 RepID=A0AAV4S9V3_CAEEX|nr:hypothetical protein CEXT_325951 [Caerostris extrusa]
MCFGKCDEFSLRGGLWKSVTREGRNEPLARFMWLTKTNTYLAFPFVLGDLSLTLMTWNGDEKGYSSPIQVPVIPFSINTPPPRHPSEKTVSGCNRARGLNK